MREIVISWGRAGHMAELVDALVSGTSGATLGSSSLLMPTTNFCYRARSARLEKFSAAAECAKRTKTGDKNLKQFWGCSSVDRALRSHRRGRGFESHQLHQFSLTKNPRRTPGFLFKKIEHVSAERSGDGCRGTNAGHHAGYDVKTSA